MLFNKFEFRKRFAEIKEIIIAELRCFQGGLTYCLAPRQLCIKIMAE